MTRKHFEIIAASLKEQNASFETCNKVSKALTECNGRFDHDRFMLACGIIANICRD